MKILLISPPSPNLIRSNLPSVVEDETGAFPPLGLLYVAAHTEKVSDCEVEIIDCQASNIGHGDLSEQLLTRSPDIIGIQVMTFTLIDSILVAKAVRKILPKALIVFGGPHTSIYPEETATLPEVDAVVVGEGEYVFPALVKAHKSKESIDGIERVVTKKNINNKTIPRHIDPIDDLDALERPARHLIDQSLYTSPLAIKNPLTTMMSSRGCPAACTFCDRPQMGKKFRNRSAESIVGEMQHCVDAYGIGEIQFYDDTFNLLKKRVYEICDLIIKTNLKVSWDIRARLDFMTPDMILRLRDAGCQRIHYGVESGSPKILKRLKKSITPEKIRDMFTLTKKAGIETLGYFMIGSLDEGLDEYQETLDLMLSLPMDYAHISVCTPYPETDIYKEVLATGMFDRDIWKEFSFNPTTSFRPRFINEHFSDKELHSLLKHAYSSFYRRPTYMLWRLSKVRSISELVKKGVMGIKLLRGLSLKPARLEI